MNIYYQPQHIFRLLTPIVIISSCLVGMLLLASSELWANNGQETPQWQPNALGVDVSHYQGTIRWDQVKQQDITFAFVKATGGTLDIDPKFAENWHSLRAEGIIRGAYHFFYPDEDATAQANHFIKTVREQGGMRPGDLPPTLDVEKAKNAINPEIIEGIKTWLKVVEQAFCQPIIYVNPSFADEHLGDHFGGYPLWVADWMTNYTPNSQPTLPKAWNLWSFWQYSNKGQVFGVNGHVDRDKFNGSLEVLTNFTKKICP